jgi:NCS1 family nucleobase:cation symporter-1
VGTEVAGREHEQPESDRVWTIETNGINAIPDTERHGKPVELFWIWFAANISILGMFYGLALVTFYGLNFTQALAAGFSARSSRSFSSASSAWRASAAAHPR